MKSDQELLKESITPTALEHRDESSHTLLGKITDHMHMGYACLTCAELLLSQGANKKSYFDRSSNRYTIIEAARLHAKSGLGDLMQKTKVLELMEQAETLL